MNFIGAFLTILSCFAILVLSRRLVPLVIIFATIYITQSQAIDVSGINMMAIRFVEVAAAIRIIFRGEIRSIQMEIPDVVILILFLTYISISMVRLERIDTYAIGLSTNGLIAYFAFRALITTPEDFTFMLKGISVLFAPFVALMIMEALTGQNLFHFMGGVPEQPMGRYGGFRCQGSFRHAISAGTVGATFCAIFISVLLQKTYRIWALLGIAECIIIIITAHSSGPLMSFLISGIAWLVWNLRGQMKLVRLGIVCMLIGLHVIMKAPIWFIFSRISDVIGGDGWHRSNLIDKFIKSFGDWWLIGMPLDQTRDWAATAMSSGYADITNYYVFLGLNGGIVSLCIFIALLVSVYKLLGRGLKNLQNGYPESTRLQYILWGLGCAICAHIVNFTSVSYWDQSYVIWYLHLAIAVSLGAYCTRNTVIQSGS